MEENYFNIIKEKAIKEHIPIIMDDTLAKIKEVLNDVKPLRILEIGTAVGYSAICFALYSEAHIDTIEIDHERFVQAVQNIKKMNLEDRISVFEGNAVDIIPSLKDGYDIVFIDAAKSKYNVFLEESIEKIRNGGVIIADNILYKGYVMSDYNKHKQRTAVRHLREYIKDITERENLESEIFEIGDGLAITKVKK